MVQSKSQRRTRAITGTVSKHNCNLLSTKYCVPTPAPVACCKFFTEAGFCAVFLNLPARGLLRIQLNAEKLKAGISDALQIRHWAANKRSKNELENNTWTSFDWVIQNFLGKRKSHNFEKAITYMLSNMKDLGCDMIIKIHFHLDWFPENLGNFSDQQGEQDMRVMKVRYEGI